MKGMRNRNSYGQISAFPRVFGLPADSRRFRPMGRGARAGGAAGPGPRVRHQEVGPTRGGRLRTARSRETRHRLLPPGWTLIFE